MSTAPTAATAEQKPPIGEILKTIQEKVREEKRTYRYHLLEPLRQLAQAYVELGKDPCPSAITCAERNELKDSIMALIRSFPDAYERLEAATDIHQIAENIAPPTPDKKQKERLLLKLFGKAQEPPQKPQLTILGQQIEYFISDILKEHDNTDKAKELVGEPDTKYPFVVFTTWAYFAARNDGITRAAENVLAKFITGKSNPGISLAHCEYFKDRLSNERARNSLNIPAATLDRLERKIEGIAKQKIEELNDPSKPHRYEMVKAAIKAILEHSPDTFRNKRHEDLLSLVPDDLCAMPLEQRCKEAAELLSLVKNHFFHRETLDTIFYDFNDCTRIANPKETLEHIIEFYKNPCLPDGELETAFTLIGRCIEQMETPKEKVTAAAMTMLKIETMAVRDNSTKASNGREIMEYITTTIKSLPAAEGLALAKELANSTSGNGAFFPFTTVMKDLIENRRQKVEIDKNHNVHEAFRSSLAAPQPAGT